MSKLTIIMHRAQRASQKKQASFCLIRILVLIMVFFLTMAFKNASSQTLSFTTNTTTLTPYGSILITNNSTNPPANSSYKWTFINCTVKDTISFFSPYFNSVIRNTASFNVSLNYFDNTKNGQNFTIQLSLVDQNGNDLAINPVSLNLPMYSTFSPIQTGSCVEPAYVTCDNLICNGDFEHYYGNLPIINPNQLDMAEPWIGQAESVDYFHLYTTPSNYGIPNNQFGIQGNANLLINSGYAGFNAYYHPYINNREYLKQPLKTSLIPNKKYVIECDISLSDKSKFKIEDLGIILSNGYLNSTSSTTAYYIDISTLSNVQIVHFNQIDVQNINNGALLNPPNTIWQHLKIEFTSDASTNYNFITFGHLNPDPVGGYQVTNSAGTQDVTYYYVDNMSLHHPYPEVTLNNPTISCGQSATITASNPNNVVSYQWAENGTLLIGQTSQSITVHPSGTSTYTVTVTSDLGCTKSYSCTVTVPTYTFDPNLEPEEISQHVNSLPGNFTYVVEDPDPNSTYKWDIVTGSGTINPNPGVGTSVTINWNIPNSFLIGEIKLTRYKNNCTYGTQIYKVSKHFEFDCLFGEQGNKCTTKTEWIINSQNDISDTKYYLQGVTLVKANVTFSGCYIYMAPNAKIIVESGKTLTINSSSTIRGCHAMWDGIYLSSHSTNTSSHIGLIVQNSRIDDMSNGLVSRYGEGMLITENAFSNNLYSIRIRDYAKASPTSSNLIIAHPSTIHSNSFDKTTLMNPYSTSNSIAGIYVYNVENLTIGNTLGQNTFSNLLNGIFIKSSTINILNNKFEDIIDNSIAPPWPNLAPKNAAINIQQNSPIMAGRPIVIGNINNSNEFINCTKGIYSNENCIQVLGNKFTNCNDGIYSNKILSTSYISVNNFKDGLRGITVAPPSAISISLDIEENTFGGSITLPLTASSTILRAITVSNIKGKSDFIPRIRNNQIMFMGTNSIKKIGVSVSNCFKIDVMGNYVKHMNTSNQVGTNNAVGIYVSDCSSSIIESNKSYYLGKGIQVTGNNNISIFKCNLSTANFKGFYFNNGTSIYQFGSTTQTTDNSFLLPTAANALKVDGSGQLASVVNWYYRSQGTTIESRTNGNIYTSFQAFLASSATSMCNNNNNGGNPMSIIDDPNMPEEEIANLMDQIIEGVEYVLWEEEYQTYDRQMLYDIINDNPDLLFIDENSSEEYLNFYNTTKNQNIGRFNDVFELIQDGNYTEAEVILNGITPENDVFSNMKTVTQIYLNTWCKNIYEFTEGQYQTLYNIAYLTPEVAKDATYMARILLGVDPVIEDAVAYRYSKNNVEKNVSIKIFPQPATNVINIQILNNIELENAELSIYNTVGNLMFTQYFTTQNSKITISLNSLQTGLYLYSIKTKEGYQFNGKINVIK